MRITKKKLLSLLQENIENQKKLQEMAMDFDTEDRPHDDVQDKLRTGDTPYKKVPLPKTDNEENQNFQELLASERYREVVAKVREYVGGAPRMRGMQGLGPLAQASVSALMNIIRTEQAHRRELEQLAVELVKKELSIPEGALQFEARIVGIGEISDENFIKPQPQQQQEDDEDNAVELEKEIFNGIEKMSLEKAKRRFINGIIQGASEKGHYMYHYVADRIQEITGSEDIINQYGIMMATNDAVYWQAGDAMLDAMMGGGGGETQMAGREDVDRNTDPPTVKAVGVNFPVLVHELIKGVLEVFAIQGRPESEEDYEEVEQSEDTLAKENWDIRLGPAIWNRIRSMFPEEVLTNEDKFEIQNYLLLEIFKLPAKQFFVFMREVLLKTDSGSKMMDDLTDGIYKMMNDEDYNEETEEFHSELEDATEQISDEDLTSFLTSLGINVDDLNIRGTDDIQRN